MLKLSIVIPVYNEANFIHLTLQAVFKAPVPRMKKEIIIIDDGSKDGTPNQIKKALTALSKKYKSTIVKTIFKKINSGKGAVVKEAILSTTGDFVLIQDADLEYDPEDYPTLLEPLVKYKADVVYGSRFISNRPHRVLYFWHYGINMMLTTFSNMLTNLNLTDMETGYKVFKGDLIRKIAKKLESERFGFEPEITARIAKVKDIKIYEVGISYQGRTYAQGKKIGWEDGIKAIWEIFKYNVLR